MKQLLIALSLILLVGCEVNNESSAGADSNQEQDEQKEAAKPTED